MCRWLAYSGSPVLIEMLLYKPKHSLIDQSLHSTMGAETTNGDGFGVGWYDQTHTPGVFHSIEPAWNDRNLRELARHIRSHIVFAHIRASSGSPVQQTNCHPFRHGRWLWMHNGVIRDFQKIKRDLVLAIDPELYPFIEAVGHEHGVEHPMQGTIATSNGDKLWAFRYSSEHDSRTLFFSTAIDALRELYPDNMLFQQVDEDTRLVVSEPLGDLPGAWNEVPESSYGVVQYGQDEMHDFTPIPPD
jgi:predicted glutamine amidotransferase